MDSAPEVPPLDVQIMEACLEHGRGNVLATYGTLNTDGVWTQIRNTACHARLLDEFSVCKKHAEYLLSMTPQARLTPGNREADIAYYAWLLGPKSPYRAIVKDFNPDPEFALDYGIVVGDLDTAPVNLLYHFFIATRLVYEVNLGAIWHGFVKEGLHPAMAFLATYTRKMGGVAPSHCAFPQVGLTEEWLVNFANATPVRVDPPYRTTHIHGGADSTWGPLVGYHPKTFHRDDDCWNQWERRHNGDLWDKEVVYPYDPCYGFRENPSNPKKPTYQLVTPKDRESGIKILLIEQERLLGC